MTIAQQLAEISEQLARIARQLESHNTPDAVELENATWQEIFRSIAAQEKPDGH